MQMPLLRRIASVLPLAINREMVMLLAMIRGLLNSYIKSLGSPISSGNLSDGKRLCNRSRVSGLMYEIRLRPHAKIRE
jgi:hypothetical protein